MNLLSAPPPYTLEIDGRSYPIDFDFRAGIRFELAILQGETDTEKLLSLFYTQEIPHDVEAATARALWFYRCGEDTVAEGAQSMARSYDFDQDAEAIYSSFFQAYRVDLSQEEMHWWRFRQLLFGLPAECRFMQMVQFRTTDTKGMPKEQKKYYDKMRAWYALSSGGLPRISLAQRDRDMQAYVAHRFEEAQDRGQSEMPLLRV